MHSSAISIFSSKRRTFSFKVLVVCFSFFLGENTGDNFLKLDLLLSIYRVKDEVGNPFPLVLISPLLIGGD